MGHVMGLGYPDLNQAWDKMINAIIDGMKMLWDSNMQNPSDLIKPAAISVNKAPATKKAPVAKEVAKKAEKVAEKAKKSAKKVAKKAKKVAEKAKTVAKKAKKAVK